MYDLCFYFFMLFFFSVLGWLTECISCSIDRHKLVIDRGFLVGPYCPIYGFGTLFMYLFLKNVPLNDPVMVFIVAMLGASTLEYVTSYVMEKLFKARWWDYSNRMFNLNGRVCLKNSLAFGLIGILFTYYIKPAYLSFVSGIPKDVFIIVSIVCFIIFTVDYILTFTLMSKIKSKLTHIKKDSTSEIDKEVRDVISKHLFSVRRLLKSFPSFKFSIPGSEIFISSINKALDGIDDLRKERRKRIKKLKKMLKKEDN